MGSGGSGEQYSPGGITRFPPPPPRSSIRSPPPFDGFEPSTGHEIREAVVINGLSHFSEPPEFISRPSNAAVLAGDDILLSCQASGDPHPDIHWSRKEADVDINKVKIVHGKGLRIESVHPDDEGTYICEASNLMGRISAEATLRVRERPVISVRPQAHLQQPVTNRGEPISLDCLATGTPKPAVFWTQEEAGEEKLIMPGTRRDNMYVTSDGALKIEDPKVGNSGHFVCTALNVVGSAIARSHLVIFDPADFGSAKNKSANETSSLEEHAGDYHKDAETSGLEKARLGLLEKTIKELITLPLGPTSIRVSWKLLQGSTNYLDGFRIHYRRRRTDRYESFETVTLRHASANSFTLRRLEEFVEYEIFVQPFYRSVVGLPSMLHLVRTHQDAPSAAPSISSARMVNATAAYVAWGQVGLKDHNGPLLGYQVG